MNSRLDEVQAAILGVHLRKLEEWTRRRREIGGRYLSEIRNTRLRCASPASRGVESAFHLFPLILPDAKARVAFMEHLKKSGIQSAIHYPMLITDQKAMKGFEHLVKGELTNSRRFAECEVSLPIHPFLTSAEVARVCEACNSWKT
jgi:dTDP-3-amino-3,4,6-trideoxy-alpha-D-glucose transaminase